MTYFPSEEGALIAGELVSDHHHHLQSAPLFVVFNDKNMISNGNLVLGRANIISGLNAFLLGEHRVNPQLTSDPQFLAVELAVMPWDRLSDQQRRALVDHELSHFGWDDEKEKYYKVGHDTEEFFHIVQRHGAYLYDLQQMARLFA